MFKHHNRKHSLNLIDRNPFTRREESEHPSLTSTTVVGNSQTDLFFDLEVECEGYEKEEIDIRIRKNRLVITGTHRSSHKTEDNGYVRNEQLTNQFERVFELGEYADPENMRVKIENNTIQIRMYHR